MPVLLLCHGDKSARDLLRAAIEARYGRLPPVLESLEVSFVGRARVKVGPVHTWVPVESSAYFVFPNRLRWDFTVKPMGMSVQRGSEAFDGETYLSIRGNSAPRVITHPEHLIGMRRRLWAIAATLLTPLSEAFVRLTAKNETCFSAENTELGDAVTLCVSPDRHKLTSVEVSCHNPETQREQSLQLRLATAQGPVGDLIMPSQINLDWDDKPLYELIPQATRVNPSLADSLFRFDSRGMDVAKR